MAWSVTSKDARCPKSLGNGIDPMDVNIEKQGGDALRWFLSNDSVSRVRRAFPYEKMDASWNLG